MNIIGSDQYKHFFCDTKFRVAYLNMPKCGCTTIKQYLCSLDEEGNNQNYDQNNFNECKRGFDYVYSLSTFKFTFVRHPVARFISFYKDKILRWDKNIRFALTNNGFYQCMPIDEAIQVVTSIDPVQIEVHARPQHLIVYNSAGKCCVDYLGKLESFEHDFEVIRRKVGMEGIVKYKNKSKVINQIRISKAQQTKLLSVYKDDISCFGYN